MKGGCNLPVLYAVWAILSESVCSGPGGSGPGHGPPRRLRFSAISAVHCDQGPRLSRFNLRVGVSVRVTGKFSQY